MIRPRADGNTHIAQTRSAARAPEVDGVLYGSARELRPVFRSGVFFNRTCFLTFFDALSCRTAFFTARVYPDRSYNIETTPHVPSGPTHRRGADTIINYRRTIVHHNIVFFNTGPRRAYPSGVKKKIEFWRRRASRPFRPPESAL